ncbi:MAG: ABC transporter permease [Chloroflexi bacterium]|nr:ABC transporter permease [Chloroflexota bacterium]
MTLVDVFLTALSALTSNVLRTLLTMLGIIIGIGAVITLTAASEGAQQGVGDRIRGLGSNLMFVRPGAVEQAGIQLPGSGPGLFLEDARAIEEAQFPYIEGVASQATAGEPDPILLTQAIHLGQNTSTSLLGTEPSYQFVRDFYVESGRFISEDDVTKKALVTVLGADVREELFGSDDPIGKSVRIVIGPANFNVGFNFTVIGVMETKGASAATNQDDVVIVPLPSFQARVPLIRDPRGRTNVSQINIKLTDRSKAEEAKDDIAALLRQRHSVTENDFRIQTQTDLLDTATEVERSLQVLVVSIALISLIVGGIGIMNIMLVSVTERTREIGIRKAVGAKRLDILWQFLIESFMVTMLGGTLGVLAGVGATEIAERFEIGGDTTYVVTPLWVLVGLVVAGVTGLIAGVYPAWQASRLDPIEALRHE